MMTSALFQLPRRHAYSAADEPSLFEGEREVPEDADEAMCLEMLELVYKGEKNWRAAKDIFDQIVKKNDMRLTENIATGLIEVFASRKRPMECLETLKYAREQGVRPRIHAYSSTIACCYKEQKYAQALRVFEILRNDGYVPKQITYARALSAALKSSQHELVLEIFDDMLRNRVEPNIVTYNSILNSCARVADVHSATGVLRAIRQRGLVLSQSTYHSLAICAGKTGRWELAREVFEELKECGFSPSITMYNSVIAAYAKGKQWSEIIDVYNEMPEEMKPMLQQLYLGGVLMAFVKSSDPELQHKALEIFEEHKAKGGNDLNLFAYNAVMVYYLNTKQYEKVHALAQDVKNQGKNWDSLIYQNIILAHLHSGDVKTAETMLKKHAKHMDKSTPCYRALITYYAETKNDSLSACRLSMQMMQLNSRLSRLDWHMALEQALKLGNLALYWNFRKWMKVRAPAIVSEVPDHLMLAEDGSPRKAA
ncbi:hypothetical protein Poli38472_003049 [Pythium oligandrum]|uniref:Pentacotripeptide-repeat region of PRORP domain-containing protein n=1 Tax=Pythium oligandrum TaxID=41045 RepID=A0A8K1C626_PYTOL|nr:hypothetical protein Poli38472_003049 [Pythium oligandrum]|eukprot:TMW57124.1 hypothetical protein Poli38472_003049 [Pythium oligandrum]